MYFKNRYQARKAMIGHKAIVKVACNDYDGQDYAYVLMDYSDYHVWRGQR